MIKQTYYFDAWWDASAGLWRCQNTDLNYVDSAMSYDQLAAQFVANRATILRSNNLPTYTGYEIDLIIRARPVILRLK